MTYDPKNGALPVAGYKPQTQSKIDIVNRNKEIEERVLRILDELKTLNEGGISPVIADQRWLAIGRTQIEQGFMAVNRSVFQPDRAPLPEDVEGEAS